MNVDATAVQGSPGVDEAIRDTCINYMNLMVECGKDQHKRDRFIEDPRPLLSGAGMEIPDDVPILLEVGLNFPTLHVKENGGKVATYQGKSSIAVIGDIKGHGKYADKGTLKDSADLDPKVNETLAEPGVDAVVVMPFFDLYSDMLGVVKFQDNAEIILTSC